MSVTDGDSLELDVGGERTEVRLIGVNASEHGECFSDRALNYLVDSIEGERVGFEPIGDDQFARTLANLWIDDDLVNLALVLDGFAIAQTADDDNPHGESVLEAEELAYRDEVGLWAPDACGESADQPQVLLDVTGSTFDPAGPDDEYLGDEVVILGNDGPETIDLSGFTLRDESSLNRYIFPKESNIEPGDVIEVDSGCGSKFSICQGRSIWNNDGDMVLVLDPLGNVVVRHRY